MAGHGMGWLDWTLMIGFYVAVLALLATTVALLARGLRSGESATRR